MKNKVNHEEANSKSSNVWLFLILLFTICIGALIIYFSNTTATQTLSNDFTINQNSEFKNVFNIDRGHIVPKIKLTLYIHLTARIEEDELKDLAEKIYGQYDGEDYENVFMIYLLPKMEPGNGCYATSHYNPKQQIIIFGLTKSELKRLKTRFGFTKGFWIDDGWKMLLTIKNENGKFYLYKYDRIFSTDKTLLDIKIKGTDTIYKIHDAIDNAYYNINKKSRFLEIYDKNGYISKFLSE